MIPWFGHSEVTIIYPESSPISYKRLICPINYFSSFLVVISFIMQTCGIHSMIIFHCHITQGMFSPILMIIYHDDMFHYHLYKYNHYIIGYMGYWIIYQWSIIIVQL